MKAVKPEIIRISTLVEISAWLRSMEQGVPILLSWEEENTSFFITARTADLLKDGDLVLVDAGCEYKNFAGDITRTFPVNGKFSSNRNLSTRSFWNLKSNLLKAFQKNPILLRPIKNL